MPLVHAGEAAVEPPRGEAHERARKIRPEFTRGRLVRVAGGRNQAEAELIQNLLLEEGVPSMLRRSAGFDVPDFLAAGPRDVLVPESGAEAARELLHQTELIAPPTEDEPFGNRALLIGLAVLGGGAVTALIAWLLLEAAR
jgi:pimeloyl-ACP methyl ester carboxylesterase